MALVCRVKALCASAFCIAEYKAGICAIFVSAMLFAN